ncbi:MAG: hypothetical protein M3N52_04180 [Actinomycetota bacterium]|nr:hypothetical protein [Actinomycetota bacterium]
MPTNHKLTQVHDRLADQVQALIDSQDWREFLTVASRFHRYSIGGSDISERGECEVVLRGPR